MMMIRSQDKEKFYPITNGIYVYGNAMMMDLGGVGANGRDVLLGEYDSEARCLEILDEIQQLFGNYLTVSKFDEAQFMYEYPKVYQMPEK